MDAQKLKNVIEVIRDLAEQRMLEPLLKHAVRTALNLLNGEYGYLILLTSNGDLDFRIHQGWMDNRSADPEIQVSRTILDQVISKRQPLLTADAIADPKLWTLASVASLKLRSVMCAPLIAHERMLGVLYLENRTDRQIFDNDDLKVLEFLAAHLAISIENAQLNDDLEKRVEERTNELKQALEDVTRYSGQLMRANEDLETEVITRRRAEDQLRTLSSVIEQGSNGVVIMDSARRIEYINPAFTVLTGYTANDVVGQPADKVADALGLAEIESAAWDALVDGRAQQTEVHYKKKSGESYWERLVLTAIRNTENAISHYVIIKEDITLKKLSEAELSVLATTDSLTGVFNRRHFFLEAEKTFQRSLRYQEPLSILMIDADHFKKINDTHGHKIGDQVLTGLAEQLNRIIRSADTLGRYGGEEFVILMPGIELSAAYAMAKRLCAQIATQPIQTDQGELNVTISIGAAAFDLPTDKSLMQVIEKADQALYSAKHNGRNRAEARK